MLSVSHRCAKKGPGRPLLSASRQRLTASEPEHHGDLFAGVNTHSNRHTLAILSGAGARRDDSHLPPGLRRYKDLIGPLAGIGLVTTIVVAGTNSYSAGLTRLLTAAGYTVPEVLRPVRQVERLHGKVRPDR